MASSGKFTWRITDFSGRQPDRPIYSDVFTVGGCNWQIKVYPRGREDLLSAYLEVADVVGLPSGWRIDVAKYRLTIVNQLQSNDSTTRDSHTREFTAIEYFWGWRSFKRLSELHDSSKGYLVNDTIVVEAELEVLNVSPPTVLMLDTFLSDLGKFITDADQGQNSLVPSSNGGLKYKVPSLKEVEMAKQSLKECLYYLVNLKINDRLAKSLETLSQADIDIGLSSKEQRAVEDFLTFEHEKSAFVLHKLARDQNLRSIKNYHETHLSHKQHLEDLIKEEEQYKKRMMEAKSKKEKLISDWQTSMTELEKRKSEYTALEKKLEEADHRKAEKRISLAASFEVCMLCKRESD